MRSEVKVADVTDGTSNTYLLGEKPIDADHYFDSVDGGDDWSWDTGLQDDIVRASGLVQRRRAAVYLFSAHKGHSRLQ